MADLAREDLDAFVKMLGRAYIRFDAIPDGATRVWGALRELASDGGFLFVDAPTPPPAPIPVASLTDAQAEAAAAVMTDEDQIPF